MALSFGYSQRHASTKDLVDDQGNIKCKDEKCGVKTRKCINLKGPKPNNMILERRLSFTTLVQAEHGGKEEDEVDSSPNMGNLTALSLLAPTPSTELDAAANEKPETSLTRWTRAGTKAAKLGKGLLKDVKAQSLSLRYWLEAIDASHRYGHSLHRYFNVWSASESTQPFFFWLDIGDGKEVNLTECPRTLLQSQCITYLGPKERQAYEVVIEGGKLLNRQSKSFVETVEGTEWIFVLSTARTLYVGQKHKGQFQHSSFLSGAATIAAGRIICYGGVVDAVWPYSGHYLPTEEHFREFIGFLRENHVDLTNVKMYSIDDDNHFV